VLTLIRKLQSEFSDQSHIFTSFKEVTAARGEPPQIVASVLAHVRQPGSGYVDPGLARRYAIDVLWSIGKLPWRVMQPLADGGELRIEAHGSVLFTPPTFDAAKPFRLEVDLAAGASATVLDTLFLGAPARRF
jgi:hypothetical protein